MVLVVVFGYYYSQAFLEKSGLKYYFVKLHYLNSHRHCNSVITQMENRWNSSQDNCILTNKINDFIVLIIRDKQNRPWWPSGLGDGQFPNTLCFRWGPRFESYVRHKCKWTNLYGRINTYGWYPATVHSTRWIVTATSPSILCSRDIVTLYVYILIQNKPHIFDHFLFIQSSGLEYW